MADMYKSDGVANLRADETTKNAAPTASPSGSGKDCGGKENLKADYKVMSAAGDKTPSGSASHTPSGVQHFNGEAA